MNKKLKLVHIDDDKFLLHMYAEKFSEVGFEVYSIEKNQSDFVEEIIKQKPDIIVSDVVHGSDQPNGIEILKAIKKDERLCDVPFVFLTNSADLIHKEDLSEFHISKIIIKASHTPIEVANQIHQLVSA